MVFAGEDMAFDRGNFINALVRGAENLYHSLIPPENRDIFLESGILKRWFYALSHVFFEKFFYPYLFITVAVLYLLYRYAKRGKEPAVYANPFPGEVFRFSRARTGHWLFFLLFLASAVVLCRAIYYPELSFWENGDTMTHAGFIMHGFVPVHWGHNRFFPLAHQEWSFIYPVTTDMRFIRAFLFSELLLSAFLLYRLLDFIKVEKRLAFLSALFLLPAILKAYSGVIYSERNIILLLSASLLFLRRFYRTGRSLWPGVLCFYLSFYFKETGFLLAAGALFLSLFQKFHAGLLKMKDFLHPAALLRRFPLEMLLALGIIFYFLPFSVTLIDPASYTDERSEGFLRFLKGTALEQGIFLFALVLFVRNLAAAFKEKRLKDLAFFPEGLMAGAILYHLAISSLTIPAGYYLMLSVLFSMLYILYRIKSRVILYPFMGVMILVSLYQNYHSYKSGYDGQALGETYAYLEKEVFPAEEITNLYLSDDMYGSSWKYTTQTMASKFYYPHEKILYKNGRFKDADNWENKDWKLVGFHTIYQKDPEKGDILMSPVEVKKPQYRKLFQSGKWAGRRYFLYRVE